jgi:hypothetical protein
MAMPMESIIFWEVTIVWQMFTPSIFRIEEEAKQRSKQTVCLLGLLQQFNK